MNKYAKFVAIVMSLAMSLGARAAFEKINTYSEDRFSDVSNTAWYAKEVESTYELGLMNGISDSLFSPDGNVTIAEAITMASRVCATYNGKEISEKDGQWYEKYVSGKTREKNFRNCLFSKKVNTYEDAKEVLREYKEGAECVIIFDQNENPDSQGMMNYICGGVYALGGCVRDAGGNVFVVSHTV